MRLKHWKDFPPHSSGLLKNTAVYLKLFVRICFLLTQLAKHNNFKTIKTVCSLPCNSFNWRQFVASFAGIHTVLCQNCTNSRWPEWTLCPILVAVRMTLKFWSKGEFIDQFIFIFKSDHDLSFITLKKTLSQCTMKANCTSEQTEAIGEMEKSPKALCQTVWSLLFSYSFRMKRSYLLMYYYLNWFLCTRKTLA